MVDILASPFGVRLGGRSASTYDRPLRSLTRAGERIGWVGAAFIRGPRDVPVALTTRNVRLLPDAHVFFALVGEGSAVPVFPPVNEAETGELGHQVELGGPHVPER